MGPAQPGARLQESIPDSTKYSRVVLGNLSVPNGFIFEGEIMVVLTSLGDQRMTCGTLQKAL